jgi:hypothetical protein
MLRYNLGFIFHCSLLVRRERMLRDQLLFDETLKYVGDADWMARMVVQRYRFRRVDRFIAAYRHHEGQTSSMASRDPGADARRQNEHARVTATLRQHPLLKPVVRGYDTLQQRRVKLIGAAKHGGVAAVWRLAADWLARRGEHGR